LLTFYNSIVFLIRLNCQTLLTYYVRFLHTRNWAVGKVLVFQSLSFTSSSSPLIYFLNLLYVDLTVYCKISSSFQTHLSYLSFCIEHPWTNCVKSSNIGFFHSNHFLLQFIFQSHLFPYHPFDYANLTPFWFELEYWWE